MSLEVPMENSTEISSLIDMGFTTNQITMAITEENTYELERLIDRITNETSGKLRKSNWVLLKSEEKGNTWWMAKGQYNETMLKQAYLRLRIMS